RARDERARRARRRRRARRLHEAVRDGGRRGRHGGAARSSPAGRDRAGGGDRVTAVDSGLELGYAFAAANPAEHDRLVSIARAHSVGEVVEAVDSGAFTAAAESDPTGFW